MQLVTIDDVYCYCFMLAKDLLFKLHSNNDTQLSLSIENEATWFLKMGKLYSHQLLIFNIVITN